MQERLKNALTAIGFCMLALVMTSVFATTKKKKPSNIINFLFFFIYFIDILFYLTKARSSMKKTFKKLLLIFLIFSHITITIPAPKFPPFSTTSAPLPPNDNDH